MRGERARTAVGDPTPCLTLGSSPLVAWTFSPARLNAVGAGVPALCRARRARLHYVGREDPGDGHRNRAAQRPPSRRGIPHARTRRTPGPAGPAAVKPQIRTHSLRAPETLRNRLTHRFLRWLSVSFEVGWLAVRAALEWSLWPLAGCVSPLRGRRGGGQMRMCRSSRAGRPRGDHAGVARCSAIELPPSTTRYCPVM